MAAEAEQVKPISPVVTYSNVPEITFVGKGRADLPALRLNSGIVLTRWHMTFLERVRVFLSGDIWLSVHTFGAPLQPVMIDTINPEIVIEDPRSGDALWL